jgi:hypothetical protein
MYEKAFAKRAHLYKWNPAILLKRNRQQFRTFLLDYFYMERNDIIIILVFTFLTGAGLGFYIARIVFN